MSVWRKRALEAFPDLRRELEDPNCTIYGVFSDLVPRCVEAHKIGNTVELRKIYECADWRHVQKSYDLGNAAGVAFYEHLADAEITLRELLKWVKPHIFADVAELLRTRLKPERFEQLNKGFRLSQNTRPSRLRL
jgi:hypothetical protein